MSYKGKFSLIIPVFNTGEKIKTMLSSISNQTYKNYEVIIIDNNSTDNSIEIVRDFEDDLSSVLFLSEAKQGSGAARNLGIEHASADWIIFLDADDYIESNYLEEFAKILNNNVEIAICGFDWIDFNTGENRITVNNKGLAKENPYATIQIGQFPSYHAYLWNKCFKKSIIEKYKINFHEELIVCQDLPFVVEYFTKIKSVELIYKVLYHYYIHEESASHSKSSKEFREKDLFRDVAFNYCINGTDSYFENVNKYYRNLQIINRMRLLKDMKRTEYPRYMYYLNKWRSGQINSVKNVLLDRNLSFKDKYKSYLSGLVMVITGLDLRFKS